MRKVILLSTLTVLAIAVVLTAQDKPWFDVEKCAFCKVMNAEPGLLQNTKTEYHNLSNGILAITHVDKEYQPAFQRAMDGMAKLVQDMQTSGKVPYMCQHCTMMGEFMMAGVQEEQIHSEFGDIFLMTSPDSAMVAKLQMFGQRTNEEMAKFHKAGSTTKPGK